MTQVNGSEFQKFAESVNRGIPETTSTVRDKENVIAAKKRILSHPDCPTEAKAELLKDIAKLEAEIEKLEKRKKNEKHEQVINTSIFPKRKIG